MAHNGGNNSDSSNESLNGSWVNLDGSPPNGNSVHYSPTGSQAGVMEDLLAEAVEDHYRQNSNGEKSPSPRNPSQEVPASILPQEPKTDWIWEWSSGIERHPPKEWRLRHPSKSKKMPPRTPLSLRRTKVMKSDLLNVNIYVVLPTILLSHLVAFGIGVYVGRKITETHAV
ncbi:BCL2/adenovirus E1B 19 kDa protein-interacting protein 3 [Nematostella vectensis]|uniref:BCL2/adenovirus E1B 19 kDa protein-interacting protein 3 n=1 Tax=Nematostella vectensis TaxID=45351 RepID=UPI0020771A8F|nr:BCL2/adenovirus E1B 19 kDa protein-interacting protein 3 [Nematostella vectensis]